MLENTLAIIFASLLAIAPGVYLFVTVRRSRRAQDKALMERRIHRSLHFECPQGEYCDTSLRSCQGYKEPVSA